MAGKKKSWQAPPEGLGLIKCSVNGCGRPLSEHKLTEACPHLKGERLTVRQGRMRKLPGHKK